MSRLALVTDRKFNNIAVSVGNTSKIISSPGDLPYAGATNRTGVPIFDGADAGNYEACFVGIADASSAASLSVLSGPSAGNRVIGFTYADVDGDSVEVRFYSVLPGSALSTATAYTWESGQPLSIDLYYGFRQRIDQVDETAIRFLYTSGVLSSGGGGGGGITAAQHAALRQLIHLADGGGPFEQFASGAYREILPTAGPFPTSVTWYDDNTKAKKIVEKTIVRDNFQNAISIQWRAYDTDGSTILSTVTDTISYSGPFEIDRIRTIS